MTNLLYLRMAMLLMTTLSLVVWNWLVEPYIHWHIALAVLFIAFLWTLYLLIKPPTRRIHTRILIDLVIDYLWVFILVYFAGRAANPFIYYYLVLTALSAALLSQKQAWSLCALGISAYSFLLLIDVRAHFSHFSSEYRIHLVGMWINYVGGSTVICLFVSRLIHLVRMRDNELAMTRESNLKNEQVIALATISATTMHDLATPLSTLSILAKELTDLDTLDEQVKDDIRLMQSQIARCNNTIKDLSLLSEKNNELRPLMVRKLVKDIEEHYALHHPSAKLEIRQKFDPTTCIISNVLFQYALVNLINNALEATSTMTNVSFMSTKTHLIITIQNESTQSQDSLLRRWGKTSVSDKENGLGIGSLLANSTIEQQGGSVELRIAVGPTHPENMLAVVHIRFPLGAM